LMERAIQVRLEEVEAALQVGLRWWWGSGAEGTRLVVFGLWGGSTAGGAV